MPVMAYASATCSFTWEPHRRGRAGQRRRRRIESRNRFVEFESDRCVTFEIAEGTITGRPSYLAEPLLARVLQLDSHRDEQTLEHHLETTDR